MFAGCGSFRGFILPPGFFVVAVTCLRGGWCGEDSGEREDFAERERSLIASLIISRMMPFNAESMSSDGPDSSIIFCGISPEGMSATACRMYRCSAEKNFS